MHPFTGTVEPVYNLPAGPYAGSVIYNQDYKGPRTTKAAVTVADHIQSFYQFLVIGVIILVMVIIGIAAIIVGATKKDACPTFGNTTVWLIVFGSADIIICIVVTIFVIARVTCCYRQSYTLCCGVSVILMIVTAIFLIVGVILIAVSATNTINTDDSSYFYFSFTTTTAAPYSCDDKVRGFSIATLIIAAVGIIPASCYCLTCCCFKPCRQCCRPAKNNTIRA